MSHYIRKCDSFDSYGRRLATVTLVYVEIGILKNFRLHYKLGNSFHYDQIIIKEIRTKIVENLKRKWKFTHRKYLLEY